MIYVVTNDEGKIRPITKALIGDSSFIPIGSITPGFIEDDGWMFCEGQQLAKKDYPELFNIIGYTYGGADDYFNLPDMREYAPCGAGKRASNTSEEMILGSCYESQIGSHTHTQNAHCHCRPAHTHTGNSHSHSGCSHTHTYNKYNAGLCMISGFTFSVAACAITCNFGSSGGTSSSNGGTSSSNSTGDLNSTTATNCATGCADGITRGRRMGMRYLVRVA